MELNTINKYSYVILFIFSFSYGQIDYQTEIQVIFDSNCTSCHGNSGGLDLTSYSSLMAGGNSGAVIVPNDHQNSILWQQISLGSMPPNGSLESSKIDLIKKWIDEGALEKVLKIETEVSLINEFQLNQNYPNPFNPVTTISYYLPTNEFVDIAIYDLTGRIVKNLVSLNQNAGYNSIQWNATNNSGQKVNSGIYLYSIQAGEFRQTKKINYIK